MTPKEKAKDLFDMFNSKNDILFHQLDKEGAKECALTAVDEIYKLHLIIGQHLENDLYKEMYYSYWEEVKQEIENI